MVLGQKRIGWNCSSATGGETGKLAPTDITSADVLALYNAGTMEPGFYNLTNMADRGIVVQALSATALSDEASGIFLNPDFQGVGDYSGVAGFAAQKGVWHSALVPAINDVVIWNGFHYKNLTGAVGTEPSGDVVNWLLLPKTTANVGYIQESDFIGYDLVNDAIMWRFDKRVNCVYSYTENFQWGNDSVIGCKDLVGTLVCINNKGIISNIKNLGASSVIIDNTNFGTVLICSFDGGGVFTVNINAGLSFSGNIVTSNKSIVFDSTISHLNKQMVGNVSFFTANLDMSDAAVFTGNVLTILASLNYVGIFTLINNSGAIIDSIVNLPTGRSITFKSGIGNNHVFSHTAIAGAVANDLICDAGAVNNTIVGRTNGTDFLEYSRLGNLNGRINSVIFL